MGSKYNLAVCHVSSHLLDMLLPMVGRASLLHHWMHQSSLCVLVIQQIHFYDRGRTLGSLARRAMRHSLTAGSGLQV